MMAKKIEVNGSRQEEKQNDLFRIYCFSFGDEFRGEPTPQSWLYAVQLWNGGRPIIKSVGLEYFRHCRDRPATHGT